jgi:ABC-type bacteriocin/lantibiotic exporter with double-glycine peptidase domain
MTDMTGAGSPSRRRRWQAPEVVQTSSMDCGPAALKCLLAGHGIAASYGRLREACQTGVDGTSVDTLEVVARQLGLDAEQVLVPADHLGLPGAGDAPSLVVLSHPDQGTHFVVVWRRVGRWVQVMDPAAGRRWLPLAALRRQLYRHDAGVEAADWRAWALTDEHREAVAMRLHALGVGRTVAQRLWRLAAADAGWFALGALDASVRMVQALLDAGGVRRGLEAQQVLEAAFHRTVTHPGDIFTQVQATYWSVVPDAGNADPTRERLRLRGCVQLRIRGCLADRVASGVGDADNAAGADGAGNACDPTADAPPPRSAELDAVLGAQPDPVHRTVWRLLRAGGRSAPVALAGAVALTTAAVMFEALLFRGLFEISSQLAGPMQHLLAMAALLAFLLLLVLLEWPIAREALRLGRQLEARLRVALLQRLPQLHDRYFQSRPISDMADRSHGIQVARGVPQLALQLWQSVLELVLTVAGLCWLAPASAPWALSLAAVALGVPLLAQPLLAERDLRTRTHAAALAGFTLDALLGLVPVRAHRAERALRREHEGLMVEWSRALRSWIVTALAADGVQGLLCIGLAGGLVFSHFQQQGGVGGTDLLLVFWALKLPALGQRLAGLAEQVPGQRNALMRLLEPLQAVTTADVPGPMGGPTTATGAPDHDANPTPLPSAVRPHGVALRVAQGQVLAGGHSILRGLALEVAAGEHVAIVGASGAGKSSLFGVLLGWHRLAEGQLFIDGRAASDGDVEALRRHTAWVDPAVQLWNRSLLDNLQYASDDEGLGRVGGVLEAAQLRGVAGTLPQGLQTALGEGGALLSGGEGQRVRLGRALMQADPRLVLLDEPFRGLDRPQRNSLLAQARRHWAGTTLLCVTHDVGETLAFGRVLVIDQGRIVEDGVPRELALANTRYRQLLMAERDLRKRLWAGTGWRRVRLQAGRVVQGAEVMP